MKGKTMEPTQRDREGFERLWDAVSDRAPGSAPVDLWPGVRARLATRRKGVVRIIIPASTWRMAASFAAGVLLALGIWIAGTGGVTGSEAADMELMVQESLFQQMDSIPPESIAGRYLSWAEVRDDSGERR